MSSAAQSAAGSSPWLTTVPVLAAATATASAAAAAGTALLSPAAAKPVPMLQQWNCDSISWHGQTAGCGRLAVAMAGSCITAEAHRCAQLHQRAGEVVAHPAPPRCRCCHRCCSSQAVGSVNILAVCQAGGGPSCCCRSGAGTAGAPTPGARGAAASIPVETHTNRGLFQRKGLS